MAILIALVGRIHQNASPPPPTFNMEGRNVIITGGNQGIGYATASFLAKQGALVILTSRNEERAQVAAYKINKQEGCKGRALGMQLDLDSLQNVNEFADKILDGFDFIDVLIFNAGYVPPNVKTLPKTKNGFERSFGVNVVAHQILLQRLAPLLKPRHGKNTKYLARVITVSSISYIAAQMDHFKDLRSFPEIDYANQIAYARSKAANIILAAELARRNKEILSFSVNPVTHFPRTSCTSSLKVHLIF